jgi:hypothetical protein
MLANAFGECQRVWFVLQSAFSFSSQTVGVCRFKTSLHGYARLVSPQSFPHLWKKLWKFQQIDAIAQEQGDFFVKIARATVANS